MKLFGKNANKGKGARTVQTARNMKDFAPISDLAASFSKPEFSVYDAIRNSVPIIDSAIGKIIRLIGNFYVECADKSAEKAVNGFLSNIKTGPCSFGITSFISAFMDSLLMYGFAAGEMVVGEKSGRILGLYNADIKCLEMKYGNNPLDASLFLRDFDGTSKPITHPERILTATVNATAASPKGRSLLEGLPFVVAVLTKIYSCIGTNWDRAGNLRYAITYKPDDSAAEYTAEQATEIANEWQKAMSDSNEVRDFVAVGDVQIKVIGADGPILDSEIPVRQMLEQIVAKTGLPPFMFGLSWSTTERMSSQQADLLTSELEYYRSCLTPVLSKICSEYLRREGFSCDFCINWNDISLKDEVELAKARLYRAQAEKLERENAE